VNPTVSTNLNTGPVKPGVGNGVPGGGIDPSQYCEARGMKQNAVKKEQV